MRIDYRCENRDGWELRVDRTRLPAQWWCEVRSHLAADGEVVARSRHAVTARVRVTDHFGEAVSAYLKLYRPPAGTTALKDMFRSSKAFRAWRMSTALASHGFHVPSVLATGERRRCWRVEAAFLLTRAVRAPALRELPREWSGLGERERRERKRVLLHALGSEIGRLHRARYVAGDLVVTNILVQDEQGTPAFWFLDHDRSRRASRWEGERPFRRNLVQLNRMIVEGITHTDRCRVLVSYARERGWDRRRLRAEARILARLTVRRRRFLARVGSRRSRR